MNIFILSHNYKPIQHYRENALYHCDKHVVKMIAESTQMLVTALTQTTYPALGTYISDSLANSIPCKPLSAGHAKHPCVVWVKQDIVHFNYLCRLALALVEEHQHRYPLSVRHAYFPFLRALANQLDEAGIHFNTPLPRNFAVAVKDPDKKSTCVSPEQAVETYRQYYIEDKAAFATWKNREAPRWWPFTN
jgi:hypothetical protein